ncbi:hypothetical protein evm_008687 [Chilo suppressalis]|nr:hypothetical protein evm_008687 [Chilo suppressalis]
MVKVINQVKVTGSQVNPPFPCFSKSVGIYWNLSVDFLRERRKTLSAILFHLPTLVHIPEHLVVNNPPLLDTNIRHNTIFNKKNKTAKVTLPDPAKKSLQSMDETKTIHKTCVRVNSADDEESRDEVDYDLPKKNPFVRGSDPRVATCRGRLQTRRCQLNQEINKELRLRAGAENLFKATTNRKLRETVALELSFVNSNLQLLKEQLAELNSSVELYQNDSKECVMPMIPLGLKETKEVDFREPFKDFIMEHYSDDPAVYEDAISDFMDMRQAMRTPVRSTAGVALLFKYYNQLYFIERRFFPPDRSLGVYFEWFDSLTGAVQSRMPALRSRIMYVIIADHQAAKKGSPRVSTAAARIFDSFIIASGARIVFSKSFNYKRASACAERELCDDLDMCLDPLRRRAPISRFNHLPPADTTRCLLYIQDAGRIDRTRQLLRRPHIGPRPPRRRAPISLTPTYQHVERCVLHTNDAGRV